MSRYNYQYTKFTPNYFSPINNSIKESLGDFRFFSFFGADVPGVFDFPINVSNIESLSDPRIDFFSSSGTEHVPGDVVSKLRSINDLRGSSVHRDNKVASLLSLASNLAFVHSHNLSRPPRPVISFCDVSAFCVSSHTKGLVVWPSGRLPLDSLISPLMESRN